MPASAKPNPRPQIQMQLYVSAIEIGQTLNPIKPVHGVLISSQLFQSNHVSFSSFFPANSDLFQFSGKLNEKLTSDALINLEQQLRTIGAVSKQGQVPRTLVSGAFHEALDGYDKLGHRSCCRRSEFERPLSHRKPDIMQLNLRRRIMLDVASCWLMSRKSQKLCPL